jgi:ribose transport system substrate-binding protein
MKSSITRSLSFAVFSVVLIGGCEDTGGGGSAPTKPEFAFVTNNPSDFWQYAAKGVAKAEQEFGVECQLRMPAGGSAGEQKAIIEDLITVGVTGMAISPVDPANQTDVLNMACEKMNVLCHDSDAPKSDRLAYVGTLNVNAGRKAGELVKALLPDGGKVMLFVGTLDAGNAQERRQGLLEAIEGTQIEVIDTRTDDTDRARAKANVEGTLTAHPDVACLVGLWEYNGPAILNALKDAEKAGKIPVVCFDENETTLEGIKDGLIHATVVQSPFEFGYQSVRILAALHKGDTSVIPENKILEIPVRVINQDNVVAFQKELEALRE